jgi:hypothetical protein
MFTVVCVVWWGFGGDVCRCFVVAMTLRSCRVDPGFSASSCQRRAIGACTKLIIALRCGKLVSIHSWLAHLLVTDVPERAYGSNIAELAV